MNVALDFDGVLFDVAQAAIRFARMRWDAHVEPHVVWTDAFRERLGETRYAELFDAVHDSESAMETDPVAGALTGIETLRRFTQLSVVTARTYRQAAWAERWLRLHDLGDLKVVAAGDEKSAAVARVQAGCIPRRHAEEPGSDSAADAPFPPSDALQQRRGRRVDHGRELGCLR